MRRRLLLCAAALCAVGCAAGGKLRENAAVIRSDIEKAKRSGAMRCAPKELALAEANLQFSDEEIAYGDARRARQHLKSAERAVKDALRFSKTCGPTETQGCPVAKDTDGDGVPDDIDRCPLDPEDLDAFQDEDGCPDADNDGDGIVDRVDACPAEAGPIETRGCPVVDTDTDGDTVLDRLDKCPEEFGPPPDGCPKKYTLVEVKKEKIEIKQQVHFATAKYRVLPGSYKLLNQVVQVLNDFPKMRLSIEGHTDNVGGEQTNMRLSQRRAEAVRDYLVSKGISPSRLEAVGFGPTKPIASNKTKRGKAKNRRTEFRIISLE